MCVSVYVNMCAASNVLGETYVKLANFWFIIVIVVVVVFSMLFVVFVLVIGSLVALL